MRSHSLNTALLTVALLAPAAPSAAQAPPPVPVAPTAQAAPAAPLGDGERAERESRSAEHTQHELWRVMRQYPPSFGEILQRDPSLLTRADYMTAYPALTAFLAQHPEVARNPSYYFGAYEYREQSSADRAVNMMQEIMNYIAGGVVLFGLLSVFVWLVKTLVDHRRWLRQSKVQVEMHTKLVDRLTTNEDLLAYTQSPAGSRFLESAPIALDAATRASAPVGRIIWSMQAGVVLMALGVGVRFVSGRVVEEVGQGLFVVSAIAGSVGAGLLVSALAAYVLSSRLGILPERKA